MLKSRILKSNKGFTLVEMLIILMIIGIVVAILVGVMGGSVTQATLDGAVAKTGDDMRAIKDGVNLYQLRELKDPADLDALLTAGALTQIPTPSTKASTATGYTLVFTDALFGGAGTDTTIHLTGVKDTVCDEFNVKYAGSIARPLDLAAYAKGPICNDGAGVDDRLIVWPAIVN